MDDTTRRILMNASLAAVALAAALVGWKATASARTSEVAASASRLAARAAQAPALTPSPQLSVTAEIK